MISGLNPLGSKLRSKNVPVVMLLLDRVMKNSEARGWMCGRRMPQGPMVPRLMLRSELKRRGKVRGSACGCVSWGLWNVWLGTDGADAALLASGGREAVLLKVPHSGFDQVITL
jgi:hypothetical protein